MISEVESVWISLDPNRVGKVHFHLLLNALELLGAYLRHELPAPEYRLLPFSIGGVCHGRWGKKVGSKPSDSNRLYWRAE